jgi:hypothetical protein
MNKMTERRRAPSREAVLVIGVILFAVAAVLVSGVALLITRPWAARDPAPGLGALAACEVPNLAWTDTGRLLRGGAPTAEGLACLAENGVDVLIDQRLPKEDAIGEARLAAAAGVEYLNLGIRDDTTPSPQILRAWIDAVEARLAAGQVVLVHDAAGRGRMGFWDAVYRMRQDMAPADAIEGYYLGKALPFDGAKIGCDDGGQGQVQALADISTLLAGAPYWPAVDEYGTAWADCPRPAEMRDWDYALIAP